MKIFAEGLKLRATSTTAEQQDSGGVQGLMPTDDVGFAGKAEERDESGPPSSRSESNAEPALVLDFGADRKLLLYEAAWKTCDFYTGLLVASSPDDGVPTLPASK
jgi:hypothetical protein